MCFWYGAIFGISVTLLPSAIVLWLMLRNVGDEDDSD